MLFTAAEKTAILAFVHARRRPVHDQRPQRQRPQQRRRRLGAGAQQPDGSADPFGLSIDVSDISSDNPAVLGSPDRVLDGPFGTVTGTIIRAGTTATLHPSDNPAVKGEVFRPGSSASGTTGAAVVTSSYGTDGWRTGGQFADRRRHRAVGQQPLRRLERPGRHGRRARAERDRMARGAGRPGRRWRRAAGQRRVRERHGTVDAVRRDGDLGARAQRHVVAGTRRDELVDRPPPRRPSWSRRRAHCAGRPTSRTQETGTTAYDTLVVKLGTTTVRRCPTRRPTARGSRPRSRSRPMPARRCRCRSPRRTGRSCRRRSGWTTSPPAERDLTGILQSADSA